MKRSEQHHEKSGATGKKQGAAMKRQDKIIRLGRLASGLETKAKTETRAEWRDDFLRDAEAIRWALQQLARHGMDAK